VLDVLYHEVLLLGSILKNVRSKTKIAQAYRIPFSTLSPYYKEIGIVLNSRLCMWGDVLKHMRICRTKHCDMKSGLFDWICHI
jgi:hypothetical protein